MKKYLLFAYDTYYPGGGMKDFIVDCDTVEECLEEYQKLYDEWNWGPAHFQIVEYATMTVVDYDGKKEEKTKV